MNIKLQKTKKQIDMETRREIIVLPVSKEKKHL